jgi:Uma2 family endonuclease
MSIATPPAEKRVLLSNIDWSTFEDLARSDRAGARFTYDHGYLEITPLSLKHERTKRRIAMMIEAAARKMETPMVAAGSTTLKISKSSSSSGRGSRKQKDGVPTSSGCRA